MKTIIFDLDGTLIDSSEGITRSAQYALSKFGINIKNRKELEKFIGPPLEDNFKHFYGLSEADTQKAILEYRDFYKDKGLYLNTLYLGIDILLKELKESGYKVILATSKPEDFAIEILNDLGIANYFDYIGGALFNGRTDKAEVIEYALSSANIPLQPNNMLMVGDRKFDIIGAAHHGIKTIAVLYGFGNEQEFFKHGAYKVVATVDQLKSEITNSLSIN